MGLRIFSSTPADEMDAAYIMRLRRLRTLLWCISAIVFSTILTIEFLSMFESSFLYLFGLAFTMLVVLFSSDLISTKIDMYESEQLWVKQDGAER